MNLTITEKMAAINALDWNAGLKVTRTPRPRWFVGTAICRVEYGMERSTACFEDSPSAAIESWWQVNCNELHPEFRLRCYDPVTKRKREVRWEYGWRECAPPGPPEGGA